MKNKLDLEILYEISLDLINEYHSQDVDNGGNPYIDHLKFVSENTIFKASKIVGLLHDILEDTDCTKDVLINSGIPSFIVDSVETVSRRNNETYSEFIDRIIESNDKYAIDVKLADLTNNMDLSRLSLVTDKDINRVKKRYMPAFKKLNSKLSLIIQKSLNDYISKNQTQDIKNLLLSPENLFITTYHCHIYNSKDVGIIIEHIPTGIIVQCNKQNSKTLNKEACIEELVEILSKYSNIFKTI